MKDSELRLAFVGDMSFGDFPFCQGFGVRSMVNQKGAWFFLEEIAPILQGFDLLMGNLETVLSLEGEDESNLLSVEMRGSPEIVEVLKDVGFSCLNVANNHILQHGKDAFCDTVNRLESKRILPVGIRDSDVYYCKPVLLKKKGKNIGLLGYAFEEDKYYQGEPLYAFGHLDLIERDIKALRSEVDFLIVSCHWGLEFMDRPSIFTIQLARRMVELGVNVVFGHHPHTLQGVERYRGGLIAYSMGNFIFDMLWNHRLTESMVLQVYLDQSSNIDYEILPVNITKDYRPVKLEGVEGVRLLKKIDRLSEKTDAEMDGEMEYNNLLYYRDFDRLRKKNRLRAYRYFLKNLFRYRKKFLGQQITRSLRGRIQDICENCLL